VGTKLAHGQLGLEFGAKQIEKEIFKKKIIFSRPDFAVLKTAHFFSRDH